MDKVLENRIGLGSGQMKWSKNKKNFSLCLTSLGKENFSDREIYGYHRRKFHPNFQLTIILYLSPKELVYLNGEVCDYSRPNISDKTYQIYYNDLMKVLIKIQTAMQSTKIYLIDEKNEKMLSCQQILGCLTYKDVQDCQIFSPLCMRNKDQKCLIKGKKSRQFYITSKLYVLFG